MAIKVHGKELSPATLRVLVCLTEKELEHELVQINLKEGEHKREPFLSLNPFGQIPAFEDGDLVLFESRAINLYISYNYKNKGTELISKDPKKLSMVWSEVEAQKFDIVAEKLVFELVINPIIGLPTDDAVIGENIKKLAKVLDVYEARLSESKYLGGEEFSLADLNHTPVINYLLGTRVKALFYDRPHVQAWCYDILARPAWSKVVQLLNPYHLNIFHKIISV